MLLLAICCTPPRVVFPWVLRCSSAFVALSWDVIFLQTSRMNTVEQDCCPKGILVSIARLFLPGQSTKCGNGWLFLKSMWGGGHPASMLPGWMQPIALLPFPAPRAQAAPAPASTGWGTWAHTTGTALGQNEGGIPLGQLHSSHFLESCSCDHILSLGPCLSYTTLCPASQLLFTPDCLITVVLPGVCPGSCSEHHLGTWC